MKKILPQEAKFKASKQEYIIFHVRVIKMLIFVFIEQKKQNKKNKNKYNLE